MASRTTTIRHTSRSAPQRPPYRPEEQAPPDQPDQSLPDETDQGYPDEGEWSPRPEENQAIPVKTVGQEQLERSREMQEMGIQNWIDAHDDRNPDNQQQAVAGVSTLER